MKTKHKKIIKQHPNVKYNPELDKYEGVILFPEKYKRAKEFLEKHPLPDFILNKK